MTVIEEAGDVTNPGSEPTKGVAETVAALAQAAATPATIGADIDLFVITTPVNANTSVVDVEAIREQYRERPRRKTGTATFTTGESFGQYVEAHADEQSTALYADQGTLTVLAVLNGHVEGAGPDMAGWGDHRARFTVRQTPEWKHWTSRNGTLGSQQQFAEHIEAGIVEIIDPDGATMLELAQSFQATVGVNFKAATRLSSGERRLTYEETVDAKAGAKGQLDVPDVFQLRMAPFEGAEEVTIEARLRYRMGGGQLQIGYALTRPDDVVRVAFESVVAAVEEQTGYSAYRGTPPGA